MYYRSLGVSVRKTLVGNGLFATKMFRKGQIVGIMQGTIRQDDEYDPAYVVDIDGGVLDPKPPFRFLNHCCEPNAELLEEPKTKTKPPQIFVMCRRTIRRGEQITIDYGWPADEHSLRCLCGAQNCRGWVISEDQLPKMKRLERRLIQRLRREQRLAPAAE